MFFTPVGKGDCYLSVCLYLIDFNVQEGGKRENPDEPGNVIQMSESNQHTYILKDNGYILRSHVWQVAFQWVKITGLIHY
jgi:hypothetical protein